MPLTPCVHIRKFKPDRLNDRTTLNRALAERLFLLVKGPATGGLWAVPEGAYDGKQQEAAGNSMRLHHEALIRAFMGDKFEAYVPSNAPIGFHWRVLPGGEQKAKGAYGDKVIGVCVLGWYGWRHRPVLFSVQPKRPHRPPPPPLHAQVFFYRSQHLKGRGRVVAEGVEEFVWVTKAEMPEYLAGQDPEYVKLFTAIL